MRALKKLRRPNRGSRYAVGLDMGDGRTLPPEDVLDSHTARLLAGRQGRSHTVPVQVEDDLSAAITVMAPNLAPLADLAEKVADAVPAVAPEPSFRRNLYEALERTHRQHRVQEAIGTRQTVDGGGHRLPFALAALAILACAFAVTGWLLLRSRKKP